MQAHVAVLSFLQQTGNRVFDVLRQDGVDVAVFATVRDLISALRGSDFAMVIVAAAQASASLERAVDSVTDMGLPLLVVCPTQDEGFVIEVLRMGADGCLCEPFGDAELLARVEAHLRRYWEWGGAPPELSEDLQVDALSCSAIVQGREVRLTPTEYRLLSKLMESTGEVVSSEELCDYIWGVESTANPSSLRLYVSHLRKKLEPDPRKPRYIRTKWGLGYYLKTGVTDS